MRFWEHSQTTARWGKLWGHMGEARRKKLLREQGLLPSAQQERRAREWRDTACHETGHALIVALLGLPIKEVQCRAFQLDEDDGLTLGTMRLAVDRRAFAKRAAELPALSAAIMYAAGTAGMMVGGIHLKGDDGDFEDLERLGECVARCEGKTDLDLRNGDFEDHERLSRSIWNHSIDIAKKVIKRERKAFAILVDQLRYSPRGWLAGGRISEGLIAHGKDVSSTRDLLLREAQRLDKLVSTLPELVYAGRTPQWWASWGEYLREQRNESDQARRAKKQ